MSESNDAAAAELAPVMSPVLSPMVSPVVSPPAHTAGNGDAGSEVVEARRRLAELSVALAERFDRAAWLELLRLRRR